ncbi:MAG: hypothetical protein K2X01_06960 [Cyanobacteria bacterium]|nr:hypothetical protein [Cyanobacteriota bacterium]
MNNLSLGKMLVPLCLSVGLCIGLGVQTITPVSARGGANRELGRAIDYCNGMKQTGEISQKDYDQCMKEAKEIQQGLQEQAAQGGITNDSPALQRLHDFSSSQFQRYNNSQAQQGYYGKRNAPTNTDGNPAAGQGGSPDGW